MLRAVLAFTLATLILAGCGSSEEAAPPTATGGTLSGRALDGEKVSLADLRGKPVFVNVWSSW